MALDPEQEQLLIDKYSTTNPLGQVMQVAKHLPQDQAAKILKYSMSTGDAPTLVANNLHAYETDIVDQIDWDNVLQQSPKTYEFLNNPLHMAAVRDQQNVSTLSDIENSWLSWHDLKEGSKGVMQFAAGLGQGVMDFGAALRQNADDTFAASHTPEEVAARNNEFGRQAMGATGKAISEWFGDVANDFAPDKPKQYASKAQEYTHAILQQVPQFAAQALLAYFTGGISATAFMGSQIAGSEYLKLREEGVEPARAFGASMGDAALQAPLESIGLNKIMKMLPGGSSRKVKVKEILESGLTEGITEWIQQYPESAAEIWARHPDYTPEQRGAQFMQDFAETTKEGIYQGLVAAPFGFLGGAVKVAMQKQQAEGFVQTIEQQVSMVSDSPLLKTSPEVIEKHLNEVTDGESVYIDPEAMVLFQSEHPKLATELGVSEEEVQDALATGAMVEVPVGKYVTVSAAHPEVHQALKDDIADDEEGVTVRRTNERSTKDIATSMEEISQQDKAQNEVKRESDRIYQQWTDAGMPKEVARNALALLVSNSYTQSDSPAQYLRDMAPMVRRQKEGDAPGALHQYAGTQALTADRLNLQEAQKLEAAGEDASAAGSIRQKTGWHKGQDNKWRFEVDDSKANMIDWSGLKDMEEQATKLYRQANKAKDPTKAAELRAKGDEVFAEYTSKQPTKLSRVLDHPDLYAAYPSIANTKIVFSDLPKGNQGAYRPAINTIELNKNLTADEMKETLLHEVQHVIQSYEQFAPGGNPSMFEDIDRTDSELERLQGELDSIINERPESRPQIERAWELEAKPEEERTDAEENELDTIYDTVYNGTGEWGKRLAKKEDELKQMAETGSVLTAFEQYQRLHGEIEARDTASRSNLTAAERRSTPPEFRDDAIIAYHGQEHSYSITQPQTETKAFKKWFGDSKVVDKSGKPLVVYHGTTSSFDTFAKEKIGKRGTWKSSSLGFFFTDDAEEASSYATFVTADKNGANVMPVYIKIENPYNMSFDEHIGIKTQEDVDKVVEKLKKGGYDGINIADGLEYVVFEPNQIKSAIGNNGTFDPNNPSIMYQNEGNPKGSIHWGDDGRAIITLLEGADASTVIHELVGHYFTQNLLDQGAMDTAPEWMKKDRQTVLEYVGIENWETATREEKTAAHEKMAEAAETYILEGKSPSQALASVFQRFAEWLTAVYRQIRRADLDLKPEIREVFDRMLASQDEIEHMELINEYHRRMPQEILSTLSEKQIAWLDKTLANVREKSKDILRGRVLKRFSTEQKNEIKAEMERVRPEIEEKTAKEPVYLAMEELRKQSGGGNPRNVANEYVRGLTNASQKILFEMLAEQYGFTSADHMMKKIVESKDWKNEVKDRVDQHIQNTFGDIYERKNLLRQEAEQAMFNEEGATLLAIEDQMLQEKLGKVLNREEQHREVIRQREMAKTLAQAAIAKMPVNKAMNLNPFMTAYRRAAEKSRTATIKGDYVTAQKEKEIQLYNHAMVIESLKTRREFERMGRYFARQKSASKDTWRKEAHFVQAAALLQRIGYVPKSYDPTTKTESLSQWAARMNEVMDSVAIADWLFNENGPLEFRKLRLSDIQDIENALRNIKKVAQTEDEFMVLANKQAIDETIDDAENLLADKKDVYVPQAEEGDKEAKKGFWRGAFRSAEKITTILSELDKWKDFGFFHNLIYDRVYKQQNELSNMMHELKRVEQENTDKYYTKEEQKALWEKKYYPELGDSVSKRFLLEMASHTGTKTNQKALFGAVPVGFEGSSLWARQKNSEDRIDADASSNRVMPFLEKHLTEKDWQWVQAGWDNINTLWPKANEMHKQQTGFSMKKVDAQPLYITLPDGRELELRGGYYPLKEDRRARNIADQRAAQREGLYTENMQLFMPRTSTGYTHERTGAAYSVDLNPANRYRHMQSVAHDIAFRPVITDLRRLVTNDRFRKLLERKIGPEGYAAITDFVAAAATPETKASSTGQKTMDVFANKIRERAVIASLMFNLKTALQNLANPFLFGSVVDGFGYGDVVSAFLNRGVLDYWAKGISDREGLQQYRNFVFSKSAFMRDKMETPDFILHEFQNQTKGEESKIVKWGSMLLAETDNLTNIPMWREAYEKKIAAGESEKNAIRFADTLIDRTSGSGRKVDTASLLRGNSVTRLLTMYQTFMNTQANGWIREAGIFMQEKDYARLTAAIGARFLLFSIASIFLSGDTPDDDKDKYWTEWANKVLSYPMQLIPIAGPLASTAMGYLLGAQSFGYKLSPVEGHIERLAKVFGTIPAVLDGRKPPQALAEAATSAAAFIAPYPDQFNRWFWNAFDMVFNDMNPAMADIIRRRPKKER